MSAQVWRDLLLISLGGLAVRLLFIGDPGHIVDLNTFGQWALAAADNPWNHAYEATDANYPPGALLVFELIGRIYRGLQLDDPVSLRIALKLPNVIFDGIGGGVLFGIAARFVDPRRALIAPALYAFNPAIIYDSSLWGQNDSITTVTALAAVWCVLARRHAAGWLLLAFAVLNKPPVIVLAPLFVFHAFAAADPAQRRRGLGATVAGIAGALVLGYLIALPFYTNRSPLGVYARMIDWYRIGSSLYPYTSANGFNVYALTGDFFASDAQRLFGVALKYWADAVYIAIYAAICVHYVRRPSDRAFLVACFLTLLGFFLVLTEMHERYLMYALAFAPALAALDGRGLWATVVLSVTQWLNLEYSLTYMWIESDKPTGVNPKEFAPVLVHLCAAANIGVFVRTAQLYFGGGAAPIRPTGTLGEVR